MFILPTILREVCLMRVNLMIKKREISSHRLIVIHIQPNPKWQTDWSKLKMADKIKIIDIWKTTNSQGASQILCDFDEKSKPLIQTSSAFPNNQKMLVGTLGICSIFFISVCKNNNKYSFLRTFEKNKAGLSHINHCNFMSLVWFNIYIYIYTP